MMSRVVEGKFIFSVETGTCPVAHYFVSLMRRLEQFHGVKIITYALMSNHFHILVEEPQRRLESITDAALVERVEALNGKKAGAELAWLLSHLRVELKSDEAAEECKARYLKRMGNVSEFVKDLKSRFAMWYNRRMGRYGVLWADRFKSVLVEGGRALWTMAAYIDLNSVRAGLVEDPKDYRWSGYGEAMGGNSELAQSGLMELFGEQGKVEWEMGAIAYRKLLFSRGEEHVAEEGQRGKRGIAPERVREVLEGNGTLSFGELMRCRVRYFADGLVLGTKGFVENVFEENREKFGKTRKTGARKMKGGNPKGQAPNGP